MNRALAGGSLVFLLLFGIPSTGTADGPDAPVTVGPRLRVPLLFYREAPGKGGLSATMLVVPPPPPPAMPGREGALSLMMSSRARELPGLFGPKKVKLSRYDSALKGAGAGMKLGWVAGCLANNANLWGEKTTWYLAGAAAAAGALFGGTVGADNPSWNVGFEWDVDEVDPRRPGDPME